MPEIRFAILADTHINHSIPLAIARAAFTKTVDAIIKASGDYVFTGHYHQRCREKRLPSGGWILTPGILEMYDFGDRPEKRLSNLVDRDTLRLRRVPRPVPEVHGLAALG